MVPITPHLCSKAKHTPSNHTVPLNLTQRTLEYPTKPTQTQSEEASSPDYVLNYAKAVKAVRKGIDYHAIEIQYVPEEPNNTTPPTSQPTIDVTLAAATAASMPHTDPHQQTNAPPAPKINHIRDTCPRNPNEPKRTHLHKKNETKM
jgi:hypothetical protein